MKTDIQIQKDVIESLRWDASIASENIGVSVKEGIVTLTGLTPSYVERLAAEKATQRIAGVRGVVEKIAVELPGAHKKNDQDIAEAIANQFKWSVQVPDQTVKATVENGWVHLSGEVRWDFERVAAENCVKCLTGIRGITNNISIQPKPIDPNEVRERIQNALIRDAEQDARSIQVEVQGNHVTLSGNVRTFREMEDAKLAAWCAPGVIKVDNQIHVLS